MSLLRNTKPLVVDPDLARMIGLNEALVLQQVHYWLGINEKKGANRIDGRTWTYNSLTDWAGEFPFWSEATIKRTLKNLRDMGLVITGNYNKRPGDRTLWYTIDYIKLEEFEMLFAKDAEFLDEYLKNILRPSGQNDHMVKLTLPSGQIDPTKGGASGQIDPTVTRDFFTETNTEIYGIVPLAKKCTIFQHWWEKYCEGMPDRTEYRAEAFRRLELSAEEYQISVDQLTYAVRKAVESSHAGHHAYLAGIIKNISNSEYDDFTVPLSRRVHDVVKRRLVDYQEYLAHYTCDHESREVLYVLRAVDPDEARFILNVFAAVEIDVERQCGVRYRFRSKSLQEVPA